MVKLASAVQYKPENGAPVLLAKGKGREAEQIMNIAQEAGIEIVEDRTLAYLLDATANPGDWIPPWCWEAMAKILSFVLLKEKG